MNAPLNVTEIKAAALDFQHEFRRLFRDVKSVSPIEFSMALHLLYAIRHPEQFGSDRHNLFLPECPEGCFADFPERTRPGFTIAPQVHIGPYIADFGIVAKAKGGVLVRGAIECDGHAFHERTKEQAERDRTRDRYFQSCGTFVLRYTGSEIHTAPFHCACDALSILEGRSAP